MKGSEFILDNVHLMYYKCHKTIYPDWIKNKKSTINPINKKDNKCFQYTVTDVLNHEEIGKSPERMTEIEPFINKNKWKGINSPSEKDDWKIFEKKLCNNFS